MTPREKRLAHKARMQKEWEARLERRRLRSWDNGSSAWVDGLWQGKSHPGPFPHAPPAEATHVRGDA